MNSAIKNEVLYVVEQLPDDADLESVIQALRVRLGIDRGIKDLDEGRTVTSKDLLERIASTATQSLPRRNFASIAATIATSSRTASDCGAKLPLFFRSYTPRIALCS